MKTTNRILTSAVLFGLMLTTANVTFAQTAVQETTTTTTAGTISEFGTDTIIVRSETSPDPIRYSYSKTTTYVDEAGVPVSIETVKSGLPVTIYYTKNGDRMVATKVIVRKAAVLKPIAEGPVVETKKITTTTTTTTNDGTISELGPETLVVRTDASAAPISYGYSKTTTYVDETGTPVSIETVKSGLPVTVYYTTNEGRMMATKVVVRKVAVK